MKLIIIALGMIFSSSCFAITGNQLYELYTDKPEDRWADPILYVMGFVDSQIISHGLEKGMAEEDKRQAVSPIFVCMPNTANFGQANDVVKKFLEENPSKRHKPAFTLVYEALITVWRCPAN